MSQHENTITSRLVYTVDQAAAALGKGRNYVYEHIGTGRLKSFKLGSSRRIAHADLVAFLDDIRRVDDKSESASSRNIARGRP